MKDALGKKIEVGDMVGVLRHSGYKNWIEAGEIYAFTEKTAKINLLSKEQCVSYSKDQMFPRIIKIKGSELNLQNANADAVGQDIKIGDKIAFQLPIYMLHCEGFEDAGKVIKLTDFYVYSNKKDENGNYMRKKRNGVLVVK